MRYSRQLSALIVVVSLGCTSALAAVDAEVPAEVPPSDFSGRQYVDSRGCVFIRAEVDGAVAWVPRLNREQELLCGFQPSIVASGSLPAISPDTPPTLGSSTAPAVEPQVAELVEEVTPEPVPETRPRTRQVAQAQMPVQSAAQRPVATRVTAQAAHVPPGYRPVWQDGRLNPNRGPQTAQGDAQMRKIWSDDVPMRLVSE